MGRSDGEMEELEKGWGGEWKSLIADRSQFPWQPQAFPTHSGFFLLPCRHHFHLFFVNFSFVLFLIPISARWDPVFPAEANPAQKFQALSCRKLGRNGPLTALICIANDA